jgi:hypothetical protein
VKKTGKIMLGSLAGCFALIGVSFAVPDVYPEYSVPVTETIDSAWLDDSGSRLLMRTDRNDYEFQLPANRLGEAIAAMGYPDLTVDYGEMSVDAQGDARAHLLLRYGRGHLLGETRVLTAKDVQLLRAIGCAEEQYFLEWGARLSGHRYPAGSRDQPSGVDLDITRWGIYDSDRTLKVTVYDPQLLERNQRINWILRPLAKLREGVMLVGLLIYFAIQALIQR